MTATIDYRDGRFYVAVYRDGRRVDYRHGTYLEVVCHATRSGVPRAAVTLTPAAQDAAAAICWGVPR